MCEGEEEKEKETETEREREHTFAMEYTRQVTAREMLVVQPEAIRYFAYIHGYTHSAFHIDIWEIDELK